MNQEQLRLECLKLAIDYKEDGYSLEDTIYVSNKFLDFVNNKKEIDSNDPIKFINQTFKLRDYQETAINLINDNNKVVFNWARQTGITETILNYIFYYAISNPYKNIVLLAPTFKLALIKMEQFRNIVEKNNYIKNTDVYNKSSIRFNNGSKISCYKLDENTGRGMTISLLYISNAAFIPHKISSTFWNSMYPVLTTCKTKTIVSSVPSEKQGLFYNLMNDPEFIKNTITAKQSNILNDDMLLQLMQNLGDKAEQELNCKFKD